MKQLISFIILIGLTSTSLAQLTIDSTITHDGRQREYILYVPASYTGDEPVPLLFNFHGMGGTAAYQMEQEGDFRPVADSAGFLVAHPQGTDDAGVSIWNIGFDPEVADDIGFTEAMIDSIGAEYNIDRSRVYAAGKSLGGFFSIHLAGQLSEKIAAIASVAGTMTQEMYDNMSPVHPTPVMQIHGTADFNVPYNGFPLPYLSVADVLQYWVDYNNCNPTPNITQLPDIDPTDGSTVEHHVYDLGDNGVTVEHFKIIGGGHTWPGSTAGNARTNFDINASEEIWNFLSRYDDEGVPTYLAFMEVILTNRTVRIDWAINSEADAGDFRMVASFDGSQWEVPVEQDGPHSFSAFDNLEILAGRGELRYTLFTREEDGSWFEVQQKSLEIDLPHLDTELLSVSPNPFNPATTVRLYSARRQTISVSVFDIRGSMVAELANREFDRGNHALVWDGQDNSGRPVPTGAYLIRLAAEGRVDSRKVSLVK
jgi:polyhydroxybutyrate depolymerase